MDPRDRFNLSGPMRPPPPRKLVDPSVTAGTGKPHPQAEDILSQAAYFRGLGQFGLQSTPGQVPPPAGTAPIEDTPGQPALGTVEGVMGAPSQPGHSDEAMRAPLDKVKRGAGLLRPGHLRRYLEQGGDLRQALRSFPWQHRAASDYNAVLE